MIDFVPADGQLGQNTPATEGTVRQGFSTSEKILLASVIISAIGLTVNLLHVTGHIRPKTYEDNDV
ncbi:MAG: hypothetical protein AMXMBFR56_62290 [Polyangiaceae bacterium]